MTGMPELKSDFEKKHLDKLGFLNCVRGELLAGFVEP